ncbi:MAG TPA: hypothetical protein VF026_13960 [Ktedonobacteraceae bacterium]
MQRRFSIGILLPVVLVLATGCQLTQTGFSRLAGDAGATFAAAATTIQYTHEGKLTPAYAASSFVNFQSQLNDLDATLPSQQGAPDKRTLQHLLDLEKQAMPAVNQPCLDTACNWHAQVEVLNRASEAFVKAGGS